MIRRVAFFALLLPLCITILQAQEDLLNIGNHIELLLAASHGVPYEVGVLFRFDSVQPAQHPEMGPLHDQFGTLAGSTVFAAEPVHIGAPRMALVGIFRNNNILWSSPLAVNTDDSYFGDIVAVSDLNRDGTVDIVFSWTYGMDGYIERLWIVSWDGNDGRIINAYAANGMSKIESIRGQSRVIDVNGDGIMEIEGRRPDTDSNKAVTVIYGWNGTAYDLQSTHPPGEYPGVIPRNHLTVRVGCTLTRSADLNIYTYSVTNDNLSVQQLDLFALSRHMTSVDLPVIPGSWDFCSSAQVFFWTIRPWLPAPLLQGTTNSQFGFTTAGFPSITMYYAQGSNGSRGSLYADSQQFYHDIITNSVQGLTVGPWDIPSPFSHSTLLDSVISYASQSLTLGWLADHRDPAIENDDQERDSPDRGFASNLIRRLETAKELLLRRDSTAARRQLATVLRKVEVVWKHSEDERGLKRGTPYLTSEGYALLKYNLEYLIERLPESARRGTTPPPKPGKKID